MKTIFSDAPPLGTIVTAAFLNALQAHRHDGGDADGCAPSNYAVDSGAANAYVIALSPVLISHTVGLPISFKAGHTNTGASTFNSGPGAIAIKKNVSVALAAGDIVAGQIYTVIYDGTNYQIFGGFFVSSDNFASSLGASGYQKLPGGLIIQWGTATLPNSGSNVSTIQVSFPIPFPAALVFAVAF
jgi:hypothetical protein